MSLYTAGDLAFEVRRSDRRKTLGITVDRDSSLLLHLPNNVPQEDIDIFVKQKRLWVYTKLAEKLYFTRDSYPERQFIDGEGICYLGRVYRIKLVPDMIVPIALRNGRFYISEIFYKKTRTHLIDWYKNKAQAYLKDIANEYASRLGISLSGIKILDLDNRWGSCSAKGVVNFNWKILQLPHSMIRYVVAHEVAHLLEKHHTPEFWAVLERLMPDYEQQLISLRIDGAKYMRL